MHLAAAGVRLKAVDRFLDRSSGHQALDVFQQQVMLDRLRLVVIDALPFARAQMTAIPIIRVLFQQARSFRCIPAQQMRR